MMPHLSLLWVTIFMVRDSSIFEMVLFISLSLELGVQNDTDPLWKTVYENVYTATSLTSIPWYAILGNHDYVKNPEAQIDYTRNHRDNRWTMPDHLYHAVYHIPKTQNLTLEIVFLDTVLLAPAENPDVQPGGKWAVTPSQIEEYLHRLESMLSKSNATWLLVAGHYPVYSMGEHGDTPELLTRIEPLLRKYRVQAYLNGHDHELQHISWHGVEYFTSGKGTLTDNYPLGWFPYRVEGAANPKVSRAAEGFRWGANGPGFGTAMVSKDILRVDFYDRNGESLYSGLLTNPRQFSSSSNDDEENTDNSNGGSHRSRMLVLLVVALIILLLVGIVFLIAQGRDRVSKTLRQFSNWLLGIASYWRVPHTNNYQQDEVSSTSSKKIMRSEELMEETETEIEFIPSEFSAARPVSEKKVSAEPSEKSPSKTLSRRVDAISTKKKSSVAYSPMINHEDDYDDIKL
jgi:tartrate-resistant acid phosphatase type 5